MIKCLLDHVSLLVESVDDAARLLAAAGIATEDKEVFSDTGTEEIYVGSSDYQALLLLQAPVADGPYRRAMIKRGPGLHHLALATDDFETANGQLASLGWLIHPASLKNYKKGKTIFYVRPGVSTRLELITRKRLQAKPCLISGLLINTEAGKEAYINGLGLAGVQGSATEAPYILIHDKKWLVQTLAAGSGLDGLPRPSR